MRKAELERNRGTDHLVEPLEAPESWPAWRPPVPRARLPSQLRQPQLVFPSLAAQCILADMLPLAAAPAAPAFLGASSTGRLPGVVCTVSLASHSLPTS